MEFQSLRNEQRLLASKLSEMEMELNEHKYDFSNLYICVYPFFLRISNYCKRKENFIIKNLIFLIQKVFLVIFFLLTFGTM